jgi:hypothetical protein
MERRDLKLPALNGFDRIYVLNLPERADRRREIEVQLRRVGLSLTLAPVRLFRAIRPPDAGSFPSLGARGCFMSHLGMLREAVRDGLGSVLILEDDVDFAPDAERRLPAVLAALAREDWAVFYGGCELPEGAAATLAASASPGPQLHELPASVGARTTHFIALRGAAIDEAARFLEAVAGRPPGDPNGGPMHVDGAYTWFRRVHPTRRTWVALPELGHQRQSRTDIHPLRWYDRWPLVRDLAQAARRVRRGLAPAGR